jgi:hypothetical protein
MKKVLFVLGLIFAALCFVGAGYVLYTDGQANAGYAVVPMAICLACSCGYHALKKRGDHSKDTEK